MLSKENIRLLKSSRNLLAFSAGVDSSALFFLLIEHKIKFDIALVNYALREQSEEEEAYALELAKAYGLEAYTVKAPHFENNFEKNARDFRYAFFDELIEKYEYDNLLTAHQLNDQLEWFLMRLTKGAGVAELMGLEAYSERQNYKLIRPLLEYSKEALLNYLQKHQHRYFVDESNGDGKYERNLFRREFSNRLIDHYAQGIKRSFRYIQEDKEVLNAGVRELFHEKEFYLLSYESAHLVTRVVDKYLKRLGYLLSATQREALKTDSSLVFGHLWAVEVDAKHIFIAPYRQSTMPKVFKESCRKARIPAKVRSYLYEEQVNLKLLLASF